MYSEKAGFSFKMRMKGTRLFSSQADRNKKESQRIVDESVGFLFLFRSVSSGRLLLLRRGEVSFYLTGGRRFR